MEVKNQLLYVGRNGGCWLVRKFEKVGTEVKAYVRGQVEPLKFNEHEFYAKTMDYNPKWIKINEQNRLLLESLGLPIQKIGESSYEIPQVNYWKNVGTGWMVRPFYNGNEIFFELSSTMGGIIIVTPERFRWHYMGVWRS